MLTVAFDDFGSEYNVELRIVEALKKRGLSDSSWGNDVCPSFYTMHNDAELRVWIDAADADQREDREAQRFSIVYDDKLLYSSDLFYKVEEELDNILNKAIN